jgi:multidrug efflux pump subunit AcrA (membrane-fusion protein)
MTTSPSLGQTEPAQAEPPGPSGAAPPPPPIPSELRSFLTSLIATQCALVGGSAAVIWLLPSQARGGGIAVQHVNPEAPGSRGPIALTPPLVERLERLAQDAVRTATASASVQTVVLPRNTGLYEPDTACRVLVVPLAAEGRTEGVSLVILGDRWQGNPADALTRIALLNTKFEAYLWRQQSVQEGQQKARLRETLELLDAALQSPDSGSMASVLCHELHRRFGCTRVSIGLIDTGRVRLHAISGSDKIDRRGPAAEAIEAAFEECAAQDTEIQLPPPAEALLDPAARRVTRAHEQLSARFGPSAMLSLPLRVEGDLAGVVLLERVVEDPFPQGSIGLLRLVAEFIGPALLTRRLADRGITRVARDRAMEIGSALVGPRHTGVKLIGATILAVLVGLTIIPIPGRIAASAEVRATTSRTIVPPFSGYLAKVAVKPGDTVKEGDTLASMDTRDLELQAAQAQSERDALLVQRDDAQAQGDLTKVRNFTAQADEANAKLELIRDHLSRAEVRSPIAGVVSRGDLDPFIGAKIEPTQSLLEVATTERTVVLQIPERDIDRVRPGQEGWFASRALPDRKVKVRILRVNPSAEVVRDANVYLAEAELLDARDAELLRVGMTGTAKLRDGWTTGLLALARPLADEFRLRFWF